VRQAASTVTCLGTQVGTYASTAGGLAALSTCQNCANGTASSAELCGTSQGVPTYCCTRPTYQWAAVATNAPTPTAATVQAYPFLSFNVTVGRQHSASYTAAAVHTDTHGGACARRARPRQRAYALPRSACRWRTAQRSVATAL
jgi:hypothetical protein